MSSKSLRLKFFLDEGVPDSVGKFLISEGHEAVFLRDSITPGSSDPVVCKAAEVNDAILVACDGDMKQLAKRFGIGGGRYKKLSLLKLSCGEPQAATRLKQCMSLIEHEWLISEKKSSRRLFIEIKSSVVSSYR